MDPKLSSNWPTLLRPREVRAKNDSTRHAKFVCAPLDQGHGDELGRALRHALLEAVPGSAVVGARATIDGAAPETAWMRELCLNLSQLVLGSAEPASYVCLNVPAGCRVRAAALGVRLADPAYELCKSPGLLRLELWIENGRGMRLGSTLSDGQLPEGVTPIDAFFGPVRRADYFTERAQLGPWSQHDTLLLEIDTNGAVSPDEALWTAVRTLTSPTHEME